MRSIILEYAFQGLVSCTAPRRPDRMLSFRVTIFPPTRMRTRESKMSTGTMPVSPPRGPGTIRPAGCERKTGLIFLLFSKGM